MNNNIPNLFIVGAGKSGTFSLFHHLAKHQDIYMSPSKEPNFFGSDLQFKSARLKEQDYLALFKNTSEYKYRGEASVSYLLSKNAAQEIKLFSPRAKILIMLRDPVDVMHARYYQNRKFAFETVNTFEEALEKEKYRKKGKYIPKHTLVVEWLFYREWVRYTEQVKKYINVFGRKEVFVGIFDDFKDQPENFYRQLGTFLDITNIDKIPREHINANTIVRSQFFNRIARGQIDFFKPFARFVCPNRNMRAAIKKLITKYNIKTHNRKPIDPILSQKLRSELKSEVDQLSILLSRDLSHWGQKA